MDVFWPVHRLSSNTQGNISLMDAGKIQGSLIEPVRRECVSSTSRHPHVVCIFGCSCMMRQKDTRHELVRPPAFVPHMCHCLPVSPLLRLLMRLCKCVYVYVLCRQRSANMSVCDRPPTHTSPDLDCSGWRPRVSDGCWTSPVY